MKSILSIFFESTNSFEGQEKDENVLLLLRRHWFVIYLTISFFSLLALVPIIIGLVFFNFLYVNEIFEIFLFFSSLWYLFIWSSLFYSLTMYTLDVWIVTDRRIIDSTQKGFFHRNISEMHMDRIQDITTNINGVIETFLDFGELQVQTAGTEERLRFLQIPEPEKVKSEIMKVALKMSTYYTEKSNNKEINQNT